MLCGIGVHCIEREGGKEKEHESQPCLEHAWTCCDGTHSLKRHLDWAPRAPPRGYGVPADGVS